MSDLRRPPAPADDPLVQTNVRLPKTLRDELDARRARKGLSRDVWIERAIRYALSQSPENQPLTNTVARTAPPPHRR